MRSSRSTFLPLLLVLSAPLQAQTGPGLGSTVRIRSPELRSGHTSGVLQRVTVDSLVVSEKAISRSSIARIDLSTGRKSHLLVGMVIGFVSGAAVGALVCQTAVCGNDPGSDSDVNKVFTAVGAGAGGVLGLGVGALIGSRKTEQWQRSSLSTLTLSPTVGAKGGLGLSLGFRF